MRSINENFSKPLLTKIVKVKIVVLLRKKSEVNVYSGADDEIEGNDDEFHTPPIAEDGIVTRSGKTLFPPTQ